MTEQDKILSDQSLDTLFRTARTYSAWTKKPVTDVMVRAIYDLMKFGPTSVNCSPARFIFVTTDEAREKLKPALDPGNVQKTMTAPVTVIIAQDKKFYEKLPKLFPHTDARSWFVGNQQLIDQTAFRNSSLQGAYLMLAARSLGLDCGPMSGFDKEKIKQAFFADHPDYEANFICNIGYGDPAGLYPRSPRLDFDEACEIV